MNKIVLLIFLQIFLSGYVLTDVPVIKIDNDLTIKVIIDDHIKKIKLIGLSFQKNSNKNYDPKKYLTDKILYKKISIETDKIEKDFSGKLNCYVYLNKLFINENILEEGQAIYFYDGINNKYFLELIKAENKAKGLYKGLWKKDPELSGSFKLLRPKLKKIIINDINSQENLKSIL